MFSKIHNNGVNINYSDYSNNPIIQEADFELFQDIAFQLKYNEDDANVSICMSDMISENTELEGKLDLDKIIILIKVLSQLKNQIIKSKN